MLSTPAIIDFVEKGNHAVNCQMKAIVLTEVLLAQGFRARRISCRPAQFDGDSHAIVMVYSDARQNWICLDPTFNTYFHDEAGGVLGFAEIRQGYASGTLPQFRSITLPRSAPLMLAGIPFDTYDAWYAVYMAKNCFSISSPLKSEFGYESSAAASWVWLLPLNYEPEEMGYTGSRSSHGQSKRFLTRNLDYFFKKP